MENFSLLLLLLCKERILTSVCDKNTSNLQKWESSVWAHTFSSNIKEAGLIHIKGHFCKHDLIPLNNAPRRTRRALHLVSSTPFLACFKPISPHNWDVETCQIVPFRHKCITFAYREMAMRGNKRPTSCLWFISPNGALAVGVQSVDSWVKAKRGTLKWLTLAPGIPGEASSFYTSRTVIYALMNLVHEWASELSRWLMTWRCSGRAGWVSRSWVPGSELHHCYSLLMREGRNNTRDARGLWEACVLSCLEWEDQTHLPELTQNSQEPVVSYWSRCWRINCRLQRLNTFPSL